MWKISLVLLFLNVNTLYALPLTNEDGQYNELYNQLSQHLHAELEHIGLIWTLSLPSSDSVQSSNNISTIGQRLAQENNVTVDQLIAVLELSNKLRALELSSNDEDFGNKTSQYMDEACNRYTANDVDVETTTASVDSGFLEKLGNIFLGVITAGVSLSAQILAFKNSTNPAERLEIFGNICRARPSFN